MIGAYRKLIVGAATACVVALCAASCSFTPLDSLSDGVCPAGEKACDGVCVSTRSPDHGCALAPCAPCVFTNASSICGANGACAVAACVGTFYHCNNDATAGCEVDLAHDPQHCGSCSTVCPSPPNGTAGCNAGSCSLASCNVGWRDCDNSVSTGCETHIASDPMNCGDCKHACAAGQVCNSGVCGT